MSVGGVASFRSSLQGKENSKLVLKREGKQGTSLLI